MSLVTIICVARNALTSNLHLQGVCSHPRLLLGNSQQQQQAICSGHHKLVLEHLNLLQLQQMHLVHLTVVCLAHLKAHLRCLAHQLPQHLVLQRQVHPPLVKVLCLVPLTQPQLASLLRAQQPKRTRVGEGSLPISMSLRCTRHPDAGKTLYICSVY